MLKISFRLMHYWQAQIVKELRVLLNSQKPNLVPWVKIFVYILYWAIFSSHIIWFFGQNSLDTPNVKHYTEYGFTTQCTHNAKFISITYDCTSTLQCNTSVHTVQQLITYFIVHLYVLYNVLNIVGFIQCLTSLFYTTF